MNNFSGRSSYKDALDNFFNTRMLEARNILPAKVIRVDAQRLLVDVEYLVDTRYRDGTNASYAQGLGIPLVIISGNNARITMPVTVGDTVLVLFSDRAYEDLMLTNGQKPVKTLNPQPNPESPIGAIPSIFTIPRAKQLDTVNIVIENSSTNVVIAPDGDVTVNTSKKVNINAGEEVNINTPTTNISGDLNVAGTTTSDVDTITAGISFLNHVHDGVETGSSSTQKPRQEEEDNGLGL